MESFKDYYGNNWMYKIATPESINAILMKLNMASHTVNSINEIKFIGNDRVILLLTTKIYRDDTPYKIAIDVVTGAPKWDQLMDMTFNIGDDAYKKIIIYDNVDHLGKQCDEFNEEVAFALSKIVNHFKNDIIFAKVTFSENQDDAAKYSIVSEEDNFGCVVLEDYEWNIHSLPSKYDFDRAKFWILFFDPIYVRESASSNGEYYAYDPNSWFGYSASENIICGSNGCYLEFKNWTNYSDSCQKYWNENRDELNSLVEGVSVALVTENNMPDKIIFKITSIPFDELLKMNDDVQEHYADLVATIYFATEYRFEG